MLKPVFASLLLGLAALAFVSPPAVATCAISTGGQGYVCAYAPDSGCAAGVDVTTNPTLLGDHTKVLCGNGGHGYGYCLVANDDFATSPYACYGFMPPGCVAGVKPADAVGWIDLVC